MGINKTITPAFSGVPKQKRTKSELDASPLPSRGPKKRQKCYHHPYIPGGSQTKREKITISCLSPAFSGAQKQAKMLRHRCILKALSGVPTQRGITSEVAASPLPSRGPKRGQKCYITPAFSGSPKEGKNAMSALHSQGSPTKRTQSEVQTYTKGNNDAPSISKYGSLKRPNDQIYALRVHCAKCTTIC